MLPWKSLARLPIQQETIFLWLETASDGHRRWLTGGVLSNAWFVELHQGTENVSVRLARRCSEHWRQSLQRLLTGRYDESRKPQPTTLA